MQQEMQYGAEASPVDYDLHEGEELHELMRYSESLAKYDEHLDLPTTTWLMVETAGSQSPTNP